MEGLPLGIAVGMSMRNVPSGDIPGILIAIHFFGMFVVFGIVSAVLYVMEKRKIGPIDIPMDVAFPAVMIAFFWPLTVPAISILGVVKWTIDRWMGVKE